VVAWRVALALVMVMVAPAVEAVEAVEAVVAPVVVELESEAGVLAVVAWASAAVVVAWVSAALAWELAVVASADLWEMA
jgi:hypothetical protein